MANKFQLKNGLEVLMLKNERSQVVSVQMWVKTGSADEPKGYEGISHFIEHLVFKGTQKYGVGEIAGLVESLGGELNAYTSFEKTVFHVTISSAYQEVAVDVISQMIFFPSFLPTEVDAEREVVCEEIRRNRDNPNRKATELHFSTVFQGHPYGKPVIGLEKTIKNISTERIKKYFEKNYSPRNMFLIVAGNFDHKKMKALIEKKFSKIEKSASKRKRRAAPKKQSSLKVRCAQSTFSQERVIFSWQIPKVESGEIEALEILACILGQGDSSRLVKELRLQSPLVNGVGVYVYKFSDCGLFFVSLNCEKEKFAEAVRGVLRQISDVKNKDVTADEVIKAINIFSSGEVYESETVDGQAFKAGEGYFYKRDVDYQKKALQRIAKLRPKDLRRVAQRFLNTDRMTVTSLGSMQSSEAKRIIRRAIKAEFARNSSNPSDKHKASVGRLPIRLRKVPAKMKEPIHYITDASGARLIIKPIKDLPFSALRVGFLAGSRIDSGKELGRAELWSRVAATGAEGLSEIEINTKIDSLAAALSPFGGRNTSGFTSEFLTPTKEEIWNLIVQLLLKPKVSTEAVEREKQIILNQIRARNDSPLRVAIREFTKAIFKGHPYGEDPLGGEEQIRSLGVQDIQTFHCKAVNRNKLLLAVCGDVEVQDWEQKFHNLVSALSITDEKNQLIIPEKIEKDIFVHKTMDKEQTHLVVGYRGVKITDPSRWVVSVMESLLTGMGGRLFYSLREKNSLAYEVGPIRMDGLDTGYFGAYIGCAPEKVDKALEMIENEFQRLATDLVSEAELNRAKQYIIGGHDIGLQKRSAIADTIFFNEIYGLSAEEALDISGSVRAVTSEEIRELARVIFSTHKVVSSVGKIPPKGAA